MNPLDTPSQVERFSERYLTHVKGELAGEPLEFADWQRKILRRIFNDVDENGRRRVRTFYLSVPRKAGKSTLAAAVALYMLLSDAEPGAEIYSAAVAAKQARLVFDIAKGMVRANPILRSRVTIHKDSLTYKDRSYKPFSNDPDSSHGLNPSCLLIDELHVFRSQLDREYFEALTSAQGARVQPLTLITTTAGYDSLSLCGEVDQYARKVESGVIEDPTFASFISRADESDNWQDPATWHKANPNLGVSVYEDYYREKAARARLRRESAGAIRTLRADKLSPFPPGRVTIRYGRHHETR